MIFQRSIDRRTRFFYLPFDTLGKDIDVFTMIRGHSFNSREALLGRVIPRGGVGLGRSVCGVCVLAALVVADTGRLCKPMPRARPRRVAFDTDNIKFGVVWAKSTLFL